MIARGDIRWFRFASPDKRRPVLVVLPFIVAIEKGERRPTNAELMKLSEVLATSVHDLLREGYLRTELSPRFRMESSDSQSVAVAKAVERLRVFGTRYVELEQLHKLRRVPSSA